MKTTEMTTTRGKDQFYQTQPSIADKILAGLAMMEAYAGRLGA